MWDTVQTVKNIYRIEYILLIVILSLFYVEIKGDWYFFFGVFFVFDVGAIGYLFSKKIGNIFYNLGHTLIIPLLLFILCQLNLIVVSKWILGFSIIWLIHIFFDRLLGWGLMPR
ncbi:MULTISPECIES: DUF4260 family protein [Lactobacillaceae]|uniref:DUF4260 family protein n=1 Tax=Lactobacillaceae TaxID=33958 RepID=UPI0004682731